jgi:hypothetical protein
MKKLTMRLCVLCFIIFLIGSCKQKFDDKDYKDNKQSLAIKEQTHPEAFLKLTSNDKRNLFGATIIKGKIYNTASVCGYKSTRVKILCYHNGIRVEEHEDVFPDLIKPGNVSNFKTKYHLPRGTDSIALSVMTAQPVLMDTLR